MRIFLIALLIFGMSEIYGQKLGRMKRSKSRSSKSTKSKSSKSSTRSTQSTSSSSSSSSSTSSSSSSSYQPIAVQPSSSSSSTKRSSRGGKLRRLKKSVKHRPKAKPTGSGYSGHSYGGTGYYDGYYYNPFYVPAGYYFYNNYNQRYPYFHYNQRNWMMDHYYGNGSSFYPLYESDYTEPERNQSEQVEYFGDRQLFDQYPYANGRFFNRSTGETMFMYLSLNKGYSKVDKMHMESAKALIVFDELSVNMNYAELKNTYRDTTDVLGFYNIAVGYYSVLNNYNAALNMYIGLAGADQSDQFTSDTYNGWSYGAELKAFFPSKISIGGSFAYYSVSNDFEFEYSDSPDTYFETYYYRFRTFDFNVAYHISRYEIKAGLKQQKITSENDTDEFSIINRQTYFGVGVYL